MKYIHNTRLFSTIILILGISNSNHRLKAGNVFSKSFYSSRPTYQSSMPEKISFFRPDLLDECPYGPGINFQTAIYGSQTTNKGSRELARYFLPEKSINGCIRIMETNPSNSDYDLKMMDLNENKTVEARHLNIETVNQDFISKVCISPEQDLFGIGLTYRQRLSIDEQGYTKWWLEASAPIVHVRNNMNFCEEVINNGDGVAKNDDGSIAIGLDNSPRVPNATEAFKQQNWRYGKINSSCKMEKWAIADIELKIGWNHIKTPCCLMNSYLGLVLPTSDKPTARYLFEPLGGNNNHFGFMFGGGTYYQWWQKRCHSLSVNIDTNYRYLFSNHQLRTFDPIGKPWGRYMEVYANREEAEKAQELGTIDPIQATRTGTSGVNVFTLPTEVTPQFSTDINTGFQYLLDMPHYRIMVEAGYNFWASQAERLRINDCYFTAALKGLKGNGEFALARTIEDNFSESDYNIDDYTYQPLRTSDLDVESASQPSALASIIYITAGCEWDRDHPKFIAFGGSWEGAANNTIMERWTAWAKFGIIF